MDMIKKEPEVDPLGIESSDDTDTDEKKPFTEEGNLLDLHVAGIKTECVDDSYDLISEIKVEETAVPTDFVSKKCKTEVLFMYPTLIPKYVGWVACSIKSDQLMSAIFVVKHGMKIVVS
ncbi:uncharacterized protein [Periplaneta americana]|uniref:uncharacterized protein isoform X2 n=1 Tax=Periplaneta americana TaxID=6978 RepID=UPI0037E7CEDF